jgi:hypothetical protein
VSSQSVFRRLEALSSMADTSAVLSRVVSRALAADSASERDLPSPAVLAALIEVRTFY